MPPSIQTAGVVLINIIGECTAQWLRSSLLVRLSGLRWVREPSFILPFSFKSSSYYQLSQIAGFYRNNFKIKAAKSERRVRVIPIMPRAWGSPGQRRQTVAGDKDGERSVSVRCWEDTRQHCVKGINERRWHLSSLEKEILWGKEFKYTKKYGDMLGDVRREEGKWDEIAGQGTRF